MFFRIGLNTIRHNLHRNISNSLSMRSFRQYNTENNTQKQKLGDRLLRYYIRIGIICGGSTGLYVFFTRQAEINFNDSFLDIRSNTLRNSVEAIAYVGLCTVFWPFVPITVGIYYYRKYYPLSPLESSELSESSKSQKSSNQ